MTPPAMEGSPPNSSTRTSGTIVRGPSSHRPTPRPAVRLKRACSLGRTCGWRASRAYVQTPVVNLTPVPLEVRVQAGEGAGHSGLLGSAEYINGAVWQTNVAARRRYHWTSGRPMHTWSIDMARQSGWDLWVGVCAAASVVLAAYLVAAGRSWATARGRATFALAAAGVVGTLAVARRAAAARRAGRPRLDVRAAVAAVGGVLPEPAGAALGVADGRAADHARRRAGRARADAVRAGAAVRDQAAAGAAAAVRGRHVGLDGHPRRGQRADPHPERVAGAAARSCRRSPTTSCRATSRSTRLPRAEAAGRDGQAVGRRAGDGPRQRRARRRWSGPSGTTRPWC